MDDTERNIVDDAVAAAQEGNGGQAQDRRGVEDDDDEDERQQNPNNDNNKRRRLVAENDDERTDSSSYFSSSIFRGENSRLLSDVVVGNWISLLEGWGSTKWCDVPKHLTKDPKLIFAALRRSLLEPEDISREWLEDPRFVGEIFQEWLCRSIPPDRMSFSWEDLPDVSKYDREVLLKALRLCIVTSWDVIPDELKRDKEIAFWALCDERLSLSVSDVPWVDRACVLDRLQEEEGAYWGKLPGHFRLDSQFAKSLPDETLASQCTGVLADIPSLRNDRDVWLRIIGSTKDCRSWLVFLFLQVFTR